MTTHSYRAAVSWAGSTAVGYDAYDRTHRATTPPATAALDLSGDPAFGGRAELMNPEQLLVAAAVSCQMLSFLAVAARARLDVVAYEDAGEGAMPMGDRPEHITRIDLRPAIVLADTDRPRPTAERLAHLVEIAHRECYIANSLRSEIVVTPTFRWSGEVPGDDDTDT